MSDLVNGLVGAVVGGPIAALESGALDSIFGAHSYRLFYNANFSIPIVCTIHEHHIDYLTITDHPVEIGTSISDHAFLNPKRLEVEAVFNASYSTSLQDLYMQFTSLQQSRELFNVVTGKRFYKNMLIESIECATDIRTENVLKLFMRLREVIIVSTQVFQSNASVQAQASTTASPTNNGTAQTFPLADQSVITAIPL